MSELRRFRKFNDSGQAKNLLQTLQDGSIECKIVVVESSLGSSIAGGESSREYEIKILNTDLKERMKSLKHKQKILLVL